MNVSCPNCATIYRVDPAKVPAGGVRARCNVCAAVFAVRQEETAEPARTAAPASARDSQTPTKVEAPRPAPAEARPPMPAPATAAVPGTDAPLGPAPLSRRPPASPRAAPVSSSGTQTSPARPVAPVGTQPAATPLLASPAKPVAPAAGSARAAAAPVSAASPPAASKPAAPPAPPAGTTPSRTSGATSAGSRPTNPFLSQDPALKARRLARALISDMVVYHPGKRQEGLRDGNLKALFEEEIKKSWEEYAEQIGREVADSTPYFREALNEILAGGRQIF
jgi:predicted Zn finger-like uncharacterized protein